MANSSASDVYVSLEFTPNPNTLKYSVNRQILEKGAVFFTRPDDARKRSPLAAKIFGVPGVAAVMLCRSYAAEDSSRTRGFGQFLSPNSAIRSHECRVRQPHQVAFHTALEADSSHKSCGPPHAVSSRPGRRRHASCPLARPGVL